MTKNIWTYSAKVTKTVSVGSLDIQIKAPNQTVLEIDTMVASCSNHARKLEIWIVYDVGGGSFNVKYFHDLSDAEMQGAFITYPYQYNHLSLFDRPKLDRIILNDEDQLFLQYKDVAVAEYAKFFIRGRVSNYSLPKISYAADQTLTTKYLENIRAAET